MALSTKTIKTKISSVKNIGKITRAMELVSVAKMKPAVDKSAASREYATRSLEIIENLELHKTLKHPLIDRGVEDRSLVILISSNKGLCGSYNVNVLKEFNHFASTKGKNGISLIAVGKYSERVARTAGIEVVERFYGLDHEPKWTDAKKIADLLMEQYIKGDFRRAVVVYTRYESAMSYKPVTQRLLPMRTERVEEFQKTVGNMDKKQTEFAVERSMDEYLFEPSEEELLDAVLPRLLESQVYQAMLEAKASEHSARMFAMKNASENAKSFVDDLTLSYNQARQSAITNEISEIAAGADAL